MYQYTPFMGEQKKGKLYLLKGNHLTDSFDSVLWM